MGAEPTFTGAFTFTTVVEEPVDVAAIVAVTVTVEVDVNDGVGDLYTAISVCVTAATTVCNHGVAGVSVGIVTARPPANMGVSPGARVIVDAAVKLAEGDKDTVTMAAGTVDVVLDAGFVLAGSSGRSAVFVGVGVSVAVFVEEGVREAVGENAGLLV